MLVTAAFPGWRSATPRHAVAFSLPAGALVFLFHFVGLAARLSGQLAPRLRLLDPLLYLIYLTLVPGLATGFLAALSLYGIQRVGRAAT